MVKRLIETGTYKAFWDSETNTTISEWSPDAEWLRTPEPEKKTPKPAKKKGPVLVPTPNPVPRPEPEPEPEPVVMGTADPADIVINAIEVT